jgi:hypothetical protein
VALTLVQSLDPSGVGARDVRVPDAALGAGIDPEQRSWRSASCEQSSSCSHDVNGLARRWLQSPVREAVR